MIRAEDEQTIRNMARSDEMRLARFENMVDGILELKRRADDIFSRVDASAKPKFRIGQSVETSAGTWFGGRQVPYDRAVIANIFDRDGQIAYGLSISYGKKAEEYYKSKDRLEMWKGPHVSDQWAYESDLR